MSFIKVCELGLKLLIDRHQEPIGDVWVDSIHKMRLDVLSFKHKLEHTLHVHSSLLFFNFIKLISFFMLFRPLLRIFGWFLLKKWRWLSNLLLRFFALFNHGFSLFLWNFGKVLQKVIEKLFATELDLIFTDHHLDIRRQNLFQIMHICLLFDLTDHFYR